MPDLVVSGPNVGLNIGLAVFGSGTMYVHRFLLQCFSLILLTNVWVTSLEVRLLALSRMAFQRSHSLGPVQIKKPGRTSTHLDLRHRLYQQLARTQTSPLSFSPPFSLLRQSLPMTSNTHSNALKLVDHCYHHTSYCRLTSQRSPWTALALLIPSSGSSRGRLRHARAGAERTSRCAGTVGACPLRAVYSTQVRSIRLLYTIKE